VWDDLSGHGMSLEKQELPQKLDAYFDHSPLGMFIVDADFRFVKVNQAYATLNGPSASEHVGKTVRDTLPHLAATLEPVFAKVLATGQPILNLAISGERPRSPGITGHWLASYFPMFGDDGQLIGVGGTVVEITEYKHAEEALRQNDESFRLLVESTAQLVYQADARGEPIGENSSWRQFTGQTIEEVKSGGWLEAVHPDDRDTVWALVSRSMADRTPYRVENRLRHIDGEWRHMVVRGLPILDADGTLREWIAYGHDITENKKGEERLLREAIVDPLTELYNRRFLKEGLTKEITRAERSGDPLILISFDLDGFKQINDRSGHHAGDYVLKEFARRLMKAVRGSDSAVRMGGDEFLVVLPQCPPDKVQAVLNRVGTFAVEYGGNKIRVSNSCGWAQYTSGETADELIRRADMALYANKQAGRTGLLESSSRSLRGAEQE
jgi:diguanylate cyclase (GGDEF)-like protein/PAS domain S-box-containing protein